MTDQTSETTPDGLDVAAIAEVLAAHRYRDVLGDYEVAPYRKHFGCSCGWQQDIGGMSGYWSWLAAHEAHVAEHLAARVAEAGARAWEEAVRECHDLGWLHDYARSDAIERNPYRKAKP